MINKELKHHILYEFARHGEISTILMESHGIENKIHDIVKCIMNALQPDITDIFYNRGKPRTVHLTDMSIFGNMRTFFQGINITIEIGRKEIIGKDEPIEIGGATDADSVRYDSNGKIICVPDIQITVYAPNEITLKDNLAYFLGHELTHAYDFYKSRLENNNPFDNKDHYKEITSVLTQINNPEDIAYTISAVLYVLNRTERNSFIAQLYEELYSLRRYITDAKSAMTIIKHTDSYSRFLIIEDFIDYIENIEDFTEEYLDTFLTKRQILYIVKRIMGKEFTTWNQLVNYFDNRWRKWKKAYMSNASKIAYDIYINAHPKHKMDNRRPNKKSDMLKLWKTKN